ncbi:MAG: tetratricopeptide repeat protein [Sphingorhabdus sp.]
MKLRVLFAGAALLALSIPAAAQDTNVEGRVTKLEKELKAVQRKVFPDGAGKYFEPDIKTETPVTDGTKTISGSEVTDLIGRVDALETQLAALTGQVEQQGNSMKAMEARLKAMEAQVKNLSAAETQAAPVETIGPKPVAPMPKTAAVSPALKPVAATPKPASAARAAAVAKIEKPKSGDGFQDSYDYGYRLWEAKFFPEAQVQLEETVKKFPSHSGTSRARNLLGRAWLDDGRPSQAAKIFYENYKADAKGERAPESLYFLGESFIAMEKPADACDVFKQLDKAFPSEAAGRLAARLAAGRKKAKCS